MSLTNKFLLVSKLSSFIQIVFTKLIPVPIQFIDKFIEVLDMQFQDFSNLLKRDSRDTTA